MKVQILSRKLINPSSPTPKHLVNLSISSLDQLLHPVYVSLNYYYAGSGSGEEDHKIKNAERSKKLQESLSETLTLFYPLAGRYVEENLSIHCNDDGVEYLEAQVSGHLSQILSEDQLEAEKIMQLNHLVSYQFESARTPLVSVQFNMFECGGIAIGICVSHRIADAFTISKFIEGWATACREGIDKVKSPSFDIASFFPAREISQRKKLPQWKHRDISNVITKRFVFNAAAISSMKALNKRHPSRLVVVTTLIWKTLIKVAEAKHGHLRPSVIAHSLNMRGKTINLPILENSCGNFFSYVIAQFIPNKDDDNKIEFHNLVDLLDDAIKNAVADCAKPQNVDDLYLRIEDAYKELSDKEGEKVEVDTYRFTSWCRFPFYKINFGQGMPNWVSSMHAPVEMIRLMETINGDGIEAWVSLDEKDMIIFQENPDILAFTS